MPDTPEARDRRYNAHAARFIPKLTSALIRSVEPAISAVELGATPAIAASFVKDTPVELVLSQLYRVVFPDEASRVYSDLTNGIKALAPADVKDSWLARASRFIRTEGATVLKGLTDRTREIVRDVLEEALKQGLGIQEAARELRKQVAQVSRSRAEAICRTEILSASNSGSLAGAQATGLRLQKAWLATNGSRTRESHRIANGQLQPLDGFFTVGAGQGRYPGDPLLPVGERTRCRCTVTYKPIN